MSTTSKVVLGVIAVIAGFWLLGKVLALAFGVLGWILNALMPVLIVGALGYAAYRYFRHKALDPGSRRSLP